jgi:threonine aldolase
VFAVSALGGQCVLWDDLVKIREWTKERGIALHLDGARLWEAQVRSSVDHSSTRSEQPCVFNLQTYYKKSFADICALFDSVYVSFYKVSCAAHSKSTRCDAQDSLGASA